jgi:Calx-beta domain/FG-GAP-like repeat
MRSRSFRPRLEPLDDRCLPSLTLSGTYSLNYIPFEPGMGLHRPMAVGDFDGDGNADLAVLSSDALDAWPSYYLNTMIEVLPGRGDGSFDPARAAYVSDQQYAEGIAAGDVNGDGRSDIVVNAGYGSDFSLLGNPDGSFTVADQFAFIPPPVPPDMNGDGYTDEVDTVYPPPLILHWAGRVGVWLHWPDGTYSSAGHFEAGGATESTIGDFNEDGGPDVAAANRWGGVAVLLNDGDWPSQVPSVRVSDATVTEGHAGTRNINFTVSLSAAYSQPVTVTYQTADVTAVAGRDYHAASGTLTFAPGETEKTITVLVIGDRLGESTEYFSVTLSGAPTTPLLGSHAFGYILDDEPSITIEDVARKEGHSGTTLFVFTVTLSAASDVLVSVNYGILDGTAEDGEDYTAATYETLTFAPGQTTTTITVPVKGDRQAESDEYFYVNLGGATNASVADSQGIGTILDDESRVAITDVVRKEGRSGKTLFVFTVTLSAAYDVPVTVAYATADGTAKAGEDYVAKAGTLTFTPGQTTKRIAVRVQGDRKNEVDETFFVNLSGATNAMLMDGTGLGTILNDD